MNEMIAGCIGVGIVLSVKVMMLVWDYLDRKYKEQQK
jgi:hypothetical protein